LFWGRRVGERQVVVRKELIVDDEINWDAKELHILGYILKSLVNLERLEYRDDHRRGEKSACGMIWLYLTRTPKLPLRELTLETDSLDFISPDMIALHFSLFPACWHHDF
jgi:hypothetical protein